MRKAEERTEERNRSHLNSIKKGDGGMERRREEKNADREEREEATEEEKDRQ